MARDIIKRVDLETRESVDALNIELLLKPISSPIKASIGNLDVEDSGFTLSQKIITAPEIKPHKFVRPHNGQVPQDGRVLQTKRIRPLCYSLQRGRYPDGGRSREVRNVELRDVRVSFVDPQVGDYPRLSR